MKKWKIIISLMLLHTAVAIFSGAVDWYVQFAAVSIIGSATTWVVMSRFNSLWVLLLIVGPFYLLYVPSSIAVHSYWTFPIWIFGILMIVLTYLFRVKRLAPALSILILLSMLLFGVGFVMPNHMAYLNERSDPDKYDMEKVEVVDLAGAKTDFKKMKGKVVLVDIWGSYCLPCIKKFPELESVYQHYKSDPVVEIISLNWPEKDESRETVSKLVQKYHFSKYFMASDKEASKINVGAVPLILIYDKDQRCRYAGGLNTGANVRVGNAYAIIEGLKSER